MERQSEKIPGLANGQEIVGSDETVMHPGIHCSEFESVVIEQDGTAYVVSAVVSAHPLSDTFTGIAREAAERDESPILAVRASQTMGQLIVESDAPPVTAGKHLRSLGAQALANRPAK